MAVGIYIRVSTDEQAKEGYSISAQRERLKAYCFAQGWEDFKFYVDEGVSAKTTDRPQFQRLMNHIKDGVIHTLLVYKLDRLTRSVSDLNIILNEIKKYNAVFRSATEVFDTSSATGRLFIQIVGSMAQWESDNLGERVRVGMMEKARQGYWSAQAPYGFKKVDKKLVIVDEQKIVLLDIIEKIKEGYSIRKVSNYLTSRGIKPIRGYKWHMRTVLDLMQNPALYGSMRWGEEIIENTHEPIITKTEFDRLQRLITSRQNFKKRDIKSTYIYQMKIVCPVCSNHLSSERSVWQRKMTKETLVTNHYRCQVCALNGRTPAFRISEENMNKAMIEYTSAFKLITDGPIKKNNKDETLEKEVAMIENQRAKYQRAWANDLMTDEEFSKLMKETKNIYEELLSKLNSKKEEFLTDVDTLIQFTESFSLNFNKLTQEKKKEFVQRFISSIKVERISGTPGKGYRDNVYKINRVDLY